MKSPRFLKIGSGPDSCPGALSLFPISRRCEPLFRGKQHLLAHPLRRAPERFEGSCVRPPTVNNVVTELSIEKVRIIDVGDFELPPPRRPQRAHTVEHRSVIEIHADDRVRRAGNLGLLLDAHHSLSL